MVRSMMSFIELLPSFWGYALETAAKLLNMAPSKDSPAYIKRIVGDKLDSRSSLCRFIGYPKETVGYYFYDLSEQKIFISRNVVFLEKGFLRIADRMRCYLRNQVKHVSRNDATSFEPSIPTDGVPVLCRSTRESQPPERYRFIGLTSQLHNDPRTYGEAMLDIDLDKWLEATKSEMNSRVQIKFGLVDPPKGANPVGEVTTFKAKLVAKGYTQRPGVDFEETYSPVAMTKSMQILLPITA
ncbi:Retrovirus-related Pol polyprotein from transposon RE2 [Sesamum angolense]|uniref:Retrovirus-related Pol polyprotein from transposon RE2 n=1 Tax=Sesamum angolense TaxID=2727404 RepID=A0AAE2BK23_9LAMI|nr:Retrovirus-related Pol polyprotein from transposon RE2 [Sesamum angolense]